ncbi:MAG: dCTP deaminase [Actinobacteria bacterium]|nr:dCTP deaminase [Actinomycetota bacterium]
MAILNIREINKRLYNPEIEKERLTVTPILNPKVQIEGPGIDLRLSNQFIVFNPEHIPYFNIGNLNRKQIVKDIRKYQSHVIVPFHQSFILHPKTIVLASTLEYISMPTDIEGTLEGRSSWARLGLIIATACAIDPGFKGCITLELTNLGNLPLRLYPGIRLAKLILSETSSPSDYKPQNKKYFCQIGPEFSKIHLDKELKIFTRKDNSKR